MGSDTSTSRFQQLLLRARNGDDQALESLINEYESELIKVVKSRLGKSLRPYLDSVDLVQSVHKSVLLGIRDQKFDVNSPQHLVRLAALIVRRKIARHWRKNQRQQRLENQNGNLCDNKSLATLLLDSSGTSIRPDDEVDLADKLSVILEQLHPTDRNLIELRMSGCTTAEAARQMDIDSDVLRARLGRVRKKLISMGFYRGMVLAIAGEFFHQKNIFLVRFSYIAPFEMRSTNLNSILQKAIR